MGRIRLTERIKLVRVVGASNYGNLRHNLLTLYPDLVTEAKRYGLEGRLEGSNFIIHHLDKTPPHYIPSCISYDKLVEDLAEKSTKESYSSALNRLLGLKSFKKDKEDKNRLRLTRKREEQYRNMPEAEFQNEWDKVEKLDKEVDGIVLIPKKFHDHLHTMDNNGKIKLPRTKAECFERYKNYLHDMMTDEKIKTFKNNIGTLRGQVETIGKIAELLRTMKYDELKGKLHPICMQLINLLENTKKEVVNEKEP